MEIMSVLRIEKNGIELSGIQPTLLPEWLRYRDDSFRCNVTRASFALSNHVGWQVLQMIYSRYVDYMS
jgi:hypothetical protein